MSEFWIALLHAHLVTGMLPFWLLVVVCDSIRARRLVWTSPSAVADRAASNRIWSALIFSLLCWVLIVILFVKVLQWLM